MLSTYTINASQWHLENADSSQERLEAKEDIELNGYLAFNGYKACQVDN